MASKTGIALVTSVSEGTSSMKLAHIPIPALESHQVLVRVRSIAQNPTDVQSLDSSAFGEGAVLGCDFVGTVEKKGDNVTLLNAGDRVAGLVWGGEISGLGAYSQYTVADERICFKVPANVSSTSAATVPLAAATAWLALYSESCLEISRGSSDGTPVLIWGGSSSVGLYAIQLARLYSIPVVAVCSPRHFDLCRSLGASFVFDYHDEDIAKKIKSAVPTIAHVFDCIGSKSSSATASQAVAATGGVLCTVRPGKQFTDSVEPRVKVTDVLVWTVFLKDHQYKEFRWPASITDHNLGLNLFKNLHEWLRDGSVRPNTSRVIPGGLDAVGDGFQMHRDGKISGFKVVYEL